MVVLSLAGVAFSEQNSVTVNFKICRAFYIVLQQRGYAGVKMINLSALGAFHMKMAFAVIGIFILIIKTSAAGSGCTLNDAVIAELSDEPVCGASAYTGFAYGIYNFINCKSFISVFLQKFYQNFSLLCVISLQCQIHLKFGNYS